MFLFWRLFAGSRVVVFNPVKRYHGNQNQRETTPMNNNSEPERDRAVESDYSAEEQMGDFAEDALSEANLASFSTHQNNLKTAFSSAS